MPKSNIFAYTKIVYNSSELAVQLQLLVAFVCFCENDEFYLRQQQKFRFEMIKVLDRMKLANVAIR